MQLDHRLAGTVQPISEYRQPLLALQGVSKRFGATVALDNVSLEFHRGQIHCVLGENGAGKSTIGKIMGGIHAPDGGSCCVTGDLSDSTTSSSPGRAAWPWCFRSCRSPRTCLSEPT